MFRQMNLSNLFEALSVKIMILSPSLTVPHRPPPPLTVFKETVGNGGERWGTVENGEGQWGTVKEGSVTMMDYG